MSGRRVCVARSLRGLEDLVALELRTRLGAEILNMGHREVRFCAPLSQKIFGVGTADDIFIEAGSIKGVPHTRDGLSVLATAAAELPLAETLSARSALTPANTGHTMEVIASFLGRRNYSRFEIEDAMGAAIAQRLGLAYRQHAASTGAADLSWRVHIREGEAFVGLRAGDRPLHRRDYRVASLSGALHPPLAFAMALIANLRPGARCLDPCCGAATTLIEAHSVEPDLVSLGMDRDQDALANARGNAARARCDLTLALADAGRLPLAGRSIDRVVCNPPWGRAVRPTGMLAGSSVAFFAEIARVLAPDGVAVVLCPVDEPEHAGRPRTVWETRVHVFGQWASLRVLANDDHDWRPPTISSGRAFDVESDRL